MRNFLKNHTAHVTTAAFFAGFLIDSLTLPRIDHILSLLIVSGYLILSALCIILGQVLTEERRKKGKLIEKAGFFLPIIVQFIFGALMSALFIYYFRSASLVLSWFFIFLLAGAMVANEIFRDRVRRLEWQVSILFLLTFAFMIFYVPIFLKKIGTETFLIGGFMSVMAIVILIFFLFAVAPEIMRKSIKALGISIVAIFLSLNALYFENIIPPAPLSLQSAGLYHFLVKDMNGNYVGAREPKQGLADFFIPSPSVHYVPGSTLYAFSSIFAPAKIETPIFHEWQHRDEKEGVWVSVTRVRFPITGGREEGYRGYSEKSALTPGRWRVLVKTEKGQIVGSISFTIKFTATSPFLENTLL